MNRTVGLTLRRTAGSGIMVALGLGALTSANQQATPVTAAAASTTTVVLPPTTDQEIHPARLPVVVYEDASPAPSATANAVPIGRQPAISAAVVSVRRPTAGSGAGFAFGYCTWWVAHKRSIPWRGNAAEWWWNARPFGFAEGQTPRPGAIMVMAAGGAASPEGHVAYVESVNPNGSFVVSEMNWWGVPGGGWGRVDFRTVTSMRGILGFIY